MEFITFMEYMSSLEFSILMGERRGIEEAVNAVEGLAKMGGEEEEEEVV